MPIMLHYHHDTIVCTEHYWGVTTSWRPPRTVPIQPVLWLLTNTNDAVYTTIDVVGVVLVADAYYRYYYHWC